MKNIFELPQNICKNDANIAPEKRIYLQGRKKLAIATFWGRFLSENSDKESSHLVGIS